MLIFPSNNLSLAFVPCIYNFLALPQMMFSATDNLYLARKMKETK
jgi:hypothetical protein